ncbi:hypothetical protein J6590_058900 [Homalodisca vitripennis]|nr:hypothetical protein J6590_058900 [Homalodisca vitripennis]
MSSNRTSIAGPYRSPVFSIKYIVEVPFCCTAKVVVSLWIVEGSRKFGHPIYTICKSVRTVCALLTLPTRPESPTRGGSNRQVRLLELKGNLRCNRNLRLVSDAVSDLLFGIWTSCSSEEIQRKWLTKKLKTKTFTSFRHQVSLSHQVSLMLKRCKCFDLSFFVVDFLWISADKHDSRFQESSLRQCQIPDAAIKRSDKLLTVKYLAKLTYDKSKFCHELGAFVKTLRFTGCNLLIDLLRARNTLTPFCRLSRV